MTPEQKTRAAAKIANNPDFATLAAEVGLENLVGYLREKHAADKAQNTVATLSSDVKLKITDWAMVDAFFAASAVPSSALMEVLSRIQAKLITHEDNGLGPLFLALFACEAALRDLTPPPA